MSIPPIRASRSSPTPPQPEPKDRYYTVQPGDSLREIARKHRTSVDALLRLNPQIRNPEMVYPGDQLLIPPRSTQRDQITSDIDPRFGTSHNEYAVEGQVGPLRGSIVWNPGDGAVGGGYSRDHVSGGLRIGPESRPIVGGDFRFWSRVAAVEEHQVNGDGTTTYKVEAEFGRGLAASGEVQVGRVRVSRSDSAEAGFRGFYEVVLPTANLSREQAREAVARINPFDPSTIPEGATVTLHGAAFTSSEGARTIRYIGVVTDVTDAAGVVIAVQRTGKSTVRVSVGPTGAVEAFNGIGLDLEKVQLMFGRQDNIGAVTLRSAEFDLSTAAGREAYVKFLLTGQAVEGPGVNDVVTIEKLDYQSQTRLQAQLGWLTASIGGPQNIGSQVRTTYADGSFALTTFLQYSGNVPLVITQRFDAAGLEIISERRYSYTVEIGRDDAAQMLNVAATGDFRRAQTGPVQNGQTVIVTFNEDGMQRLVQLTQAYAANHPTAQEAALLGYMNLDGSRPSPSAFDFAVALARNFNSNDYGFTMKLYNIASGSDAGGLANAVALPLPLSVSVID